MRQNRQSLTALPTVRICIVTPPVIGISETFIRAILDGFCDSEMTHVAYNGNYTCSTIDLHPYSSGIKSKLIRSLLALLPNFLEFRIRRRISPPKQSCRVFADFLASQRIQVVLAQYGTIASEIVDACKLANTPLVAHFHGYDCSRYDIIAAYREKYHSLFDYASAIIAVSQRMKADLIALGCNSQKITYIPYAPHDSYFDISPDYASNTLTMVGRLTEKKGPHLSILAFAKALHSMPAIKLQIIGDGELGGVCRSIVKSLNIDQSVTFLGSKDRSGIQSQFKNSSAFIQHSIEASNGDREGTPVAILEAGASGLPVITTLHAGIPDIIRQNETGIMVNEGDVNSMANSICTLFNNRNSLIEMGKKARSYIESNFTMQKHHAAIRALIRDCTSGSRIPPN